MCFVFFFQDEFSQASKVCNIWGVHAFVETFSFWKQLKMCSRKLLMKSTEKNTLSLCATCGLQMFCTSQSSFASVRHAERPIVAAMFVTMRLPLVQHKTCDVFSLESFGQYPAEFWQASLSFIFVPCWAQRIKFVEIATQENSPLQKEKRKGKKTAWCVWTKIVRSQIGLFLDDFLDRTDTNWVEVQQIVHLTWARKQPDCGREQQHPQPHPISHTRAVFPWKMWWW